MKSATVAINNNVEVCAKAQNRKDAVGYTLSVGSKLTVYHPGGKKTLGDRGPNDAKGVG